MAARRRAAAGKRWSANAAVTLYGRDGAALPAGTTATPHRAQVRWRLDGHQRKRTLTATELHQLPGFLADLRAAYEHDWDADARGWPLTPRPLPLGPTPAEARAVDDDASVLLPLVPLDEGQARPDIANIVARYLHHLETTRSPRTGRPRSQNTLRDYRYELGFVVDVLRYAPGDPRVEAGDVEVGDPLLLTDPEHGVRPSDLLAFLEYRERSNRNIAARNERLMTRWVEAVEQEERRAAREGRAPALPETPVMEAEVAEPRTVEAAGKLLKAMLTAAKERGWIDYQPWTKAVDDCLIKPAPTAYTRKSVHRRDQVDRIVSAIGEQTREAVIAGSWTEVDGDRYRAPVMLAGYRAPRPEELFAIRRSWLELERARPRIVLHNAEVDGKVVPLKHRRPDEVRYLYLDDEPELLAELRRHLELYVPEPDPDSDDPNARDPYLFTTHQGVRVDAKHFGRRWYKPAVRAALTHTGEEDLAASTLHLLRASAITHWLAVDGWSIHRCAEAAGNAIAVIEKHYKGVLADIDGDVPRGTGGGSTPARSSGAEPLVDALEKMDAATLASVAALAAKLLGERATSGPS
jgi:hypothetical protein